MVMDRLLGNRCQSGDVLVLVDGYLMQTESMEVFEMLIDVFAEHLCSEELGLLCCTTYSRTIYFATKRKNSRKAQLARRRARLDDARQKLMGNSFQKVFDAVITLQKLKPTHAEVCQMKLASPVKRVWDNTGHAAPVRSGAYQLLERFIIDAQDARGVEDSERGTVDAVLAACNIKTPRKKRRTD